VSACLPWATPFGETAKTSCTLRIFRMVLTFIGDSPFRWARWNPRVLPHPDTTPLPEVIAGLLEIVAVEGPIHAQRAYRVYTLAAGGLRVGTEMRRAFHAATRQALHTGALHQLEDKLVSRDEKTLYIPGKPSVLVRELGPRQLSDVPRSEVAKLIKYLGPEGAADDVVKRAVLHAYGLIRLTVRTSQYLDECLYYHWHRHTTIYASFGGTKLSCSLHHH
jgi:hypothetical protein